ncbi:MAG: hypothetical protein OXG78_16255 [Chloroflexi bacterium]|nr:hypothetical protein [Chloroflexota bacterium]
MTTLNAAQSALLGQPLESKVWLEGPAGSGKTTTAVQHILRLLESGVPAETILVFVPQRSLAEPYIRALREQSRYPGGQVSVHTLGSLSLQLVELFWFLVAERAGFKHPQDLPNFLSLELVQYFMTRAIEPLINQRDYFNSVRIDRARLYSQIIDNMNKAALVGFPINEIGARLKSALRGGVEQAHIFDDAQTCALAFREFCLAHNLLDFSLYLQVFREYVGTLPQAEAFLRGRYKHVVADNVEEDTPASHGLLAALLANCSSALILYDQDAGFRRFLGADPVNARRLHALCDVRATFEASLVMQPPVAALGARLASQLGFESADLGVEAKYGARTTEDGAGMANGEVSMEELGADPRPALFAAAHRYHPQMVDWVANEISLLVHERGVPPAEIVVLAPFVSDVLRFGLLEGLDKRGVKARSHRPSRALRDERAARALLTLARLAHPHWEMAPTEFDMAFALMTSIDGLDLIRAKLLTEMLYKNGALLPFTEVKSTAMQDRITFELGERYGRLCRWLKGYIDQGAVDAIDIFFRRLFGELLSRPGFGFHGDIDAGNIAMNLVDSARGFRWSLDFMSRYGAESDLGLDYVKMVDRGVIANFYLRSWVTAPEDSVLIAPAYTFLLKNQAVDYQFWLNIGSEGWSRRLYQPLTHPEVLSLGWADGAVWTEADEQEWSRRTLCRLLLALTRRCRGGVYLGYSELSESGYEQRGLLLETIQGMLRRMTREGAAP